MGNGKKVLTAAAAAAAVFLLFLGVWLLHSHETEQTLHLTERRPEEVRQINVIDASATQLAINFTEREDIERLLNEWNTIVLEPATEEEAGWNVFFVTFMLSTGDTESFLLGPEGIRKIAYGRYEGRLGLHDTYYRADLQDVYDSFLEYEKQNFDFN